MDSSCHGAEPVQHRWPHRSHPPSTLRAPSRQGDLCTRACQTCADTWLFPAHCSGGCGQDKPTHDAPSHRGSAPQRAPNQPLHAACGCCAVQPQGQGWQANGHPCGSEPALGGKAPLQSVGPRPAQGCRSLRTAGNAPSLSCRQPDWCRLAAAIWLQPPFSAEGCLQDPRQQGNHCRALTPPQSCSHCRSRCLDPSGPVPKQISRHAPCP
mmetsp:Transcript_4274/g.9979  ORF Transcript_4274/g.9979 Transcript_4274/m.9979 type:complete len:210 (-) Transcript_4274:123-752(-)